ncbi:MAG: Spy/CpxP family protein refolding chaperone [Acidobacteriota bacterium]
MIAAVVMALLLGAVSMGSAEDGMPFGGFPPGQWWQVERVGKEIGLQDQQIAQLEKIFLESRKSTIDLKADLEKKRLDLEAALRSDSLDEAKIAAQTDQLGAARTRLIKALVGTIVDARKVLTPEQWKKLQARRETMRSGGPGFGQGPGGWGGAERPRGPGFMRQEAPPELPEPPAPPEAPQGSL